MARRVADLRAALEVMAGQAGATRGRCRLRCAAPSRQARPSGPRDRPGWPGHRQTGTGRCAEGGRALKPPATPSTSSSRRRSSWRPRQGWNAQPSEIRAAWRSVADVPADTQRFMSAFYEVAGDPDPATTMQSFMTRQSLLRAWGEFQEDAPADRRPDLHRHPLRGGHGPDEGRVAETIPECAWPSPSTRWVCRGGRSRGHRGRSSAGGAGDRPSLPGGSLPGRGGGDRGQAGIITPIDPR